MINIVIIYTTPPGSEKYLVFNKSNGDQFIQHTIYSTLEGVGLLYKRDYKKNEVAINSFTFIYLVF